MREGHKFAHLSMSSKDEGDHTMHAAQTLQSGVPGLWRLWQNATFERRPQACRALRDQIISRLEGQP